MSSSPHRARINPTLDEQLDSVVRRERFRRVCSFLAVAWILVAVASAVVLLINRAAASELDAFIPNAWIWLASGAAAATILAIVFAAMTSKSVAHVARQLELDFPELDSVLVTAIEQRPGKNRKLSFLQQDVIRAAVYHGYHHNWKRIIPTWQLSLATFAAVIGLAGVCIGGLALWFTDPPESNSSVHLFDDVQVRKGFDYQLTVQPGNTEIERGTSLLVLAQFANDVPPKAELCFQTVEGGERIVPMKKSLDDPVFASRISQVTQPLTYTVTYDEKASDKFKVAVFDYPKLIRSDADLTFPTYTQMPEKKLQDVRRISAIVGTTARLSFS